MKKLLIVACTALSCALFAQEKPNAAASAAAPEKAEWPVPVACYGMKDVDVVGFRFTIPYCESESVTGFDLGLFGRCRYFEGLQINLLRNDVRDVMSGLQVGLYNSAGRADMLGLQVGLWNEARSIRGFQVGLVNLADSFYGFQVGLINRAESGYGFQGGAVNVIRENDFAFLPIVNVGFDGYTDPKF